MIYNLEKFPKIGKKSSASAFKWVEKEKFSTVSECYESLRKEGFIINASSISDGSIDFYKLDFKKKIAIVLGNEHRGVSDEAAWPLCVARAAAADLHIDAPFRSPKGQEAWTTRYGSLYWVFPNWRLELRDQVENLRRAGYVLFAHLMEPVPKSVQFKDRPGLWNWEGELV